MQSQITVRKEDGNEVKKEQETEQEKGLISKLKSMMGSKQKGGSLAHKLQHTIPSPQNVILATPPVGVAVTIQRGTYTATPYHQLR